MFRALFAIFMVTISVWSPLSTAEEGTKADPQKEMVQLAGAEFWKEVRSGESGYTTASGTEAGQLINVNGERWRRIRNEWISPIGLLFLSGSVGGLLLFYLWAGRIALTHERTGKKVMRWTPFERALHWFTAFNFLILGFSGVLLLYGKHFIKPVTPEVVWGSIIYAAKLTHNYLGPLFVIGLLCMLVKWMKNNFINKVDIEWFKQGGGILPNGKHPDAGFCNGGEKAWFWLLATVGVLVCITGLVMDFPIFGQTRGDMQIANLLHGIASLGLLAAAFGHIYIGTIGTEGAFEGMVTGYVDESWAKQHHKLWLDEVQGASPLPTTAATKNQRST